MPAGELVGFGRPSPAAREDPLAPTSPRPATARRARSAKAGRSTAPASPIDGPIDDVTKPRLTQRARAERSEKLLLEAAVALMAQQGFERTTVAQIAARAGYSPGLVNHRFGSKFELLDRLIEMGQQSFYNDVLAPALEGRRGLAALLEAMEIRLRPNRDSARTLAFYTVMGECLGPVPQIRPAYARAGRTIRDSFRRFIVEGQEDGDIRADVSVDAAAAILAALTRGIVFQWLIEGDAIDLDRLRRENRAWLTRALAPDTAPAPYPDSATAAASTPTAATAPAPALSPAPTKRPSRTRAAARKRAERPTKQDDPAR
jgi:AcrR family transcriptional regulator